MLNTREDIQQHSQRPHFLYVQIGIAFLAFLLIGANDGAFGVILPGIAAHYHMNKANISLLFLFNSAGYLIAALNTGFLMTRLGARAFLLLGLGLFAVSTGLLVLMPPFLLVLALFIPIGFGIAVLDAGLNSYIAGLPRNSVVLNYLHACYGGGALLGPLLATLILALSLGWNIVYLVWAVVGIAIFFAVFVAFKQALAATRQGEVSEGQGQVQNETGKRHSAQSVLRSILTMRVFWLVALFLFLYSGNEHSVGNWSYSFLTEQRHTSALFAGWIVSGYWMGLTLGRMMLAWVSRRIGEYRLVALCLLGALSSALLIWLVPVQFISIVGLFLLGFSFGPIFPTTIALTSQLVPHQSLSSAIGLITSFTSVGVAFLPWVLGNLAQLLNLNVLPPYVLAVVWIMCAFWLVLRARVRNRGHVVA